MLGSVGGSIVLPTLTPTVEWSPRCSLGRLCRLTRGRAMGHCGVTRDSRRGPAKRPLRGHCRGHCGHRADSARAISQEVAALRCFLTGRACDQESCSRRLKPPQGHHSSPSTPVAGAQETGWRARAGRSQRHRRDARRATAGNAVDAVQEPARTRYSASTGVNHRRLALDPWNVSVTR